MRCCFFLLGICEELEALAVPNLLETPSLKVVVFKFDFGTENVYIPGGGEGTGQTCVVYARTGFL